MQWKSNNTTLNKMYSNIMKNNNAEDILSTYFTIYVKEFITEAAVYNRLIQLRDLKSAGRS